MVSIVLSVPYPLPTFISSILRICTIHVHVNPALNHVEPHIL